MLRIISLQSLGHDLCDRVQSVYHPSLDRRIRAKLLCALPSSVQRLGASTQFSRAPTATFLLRVSISRFPISCKCSFHRYCARCSKAVQVVRGAAGPGPPLEGGKARAEKMPPEERSESARKAARARWDKKRREEESSFLLLASTENVRSVTLQPLFSQFRP